MTSGPAQVLLVDDEANIRRMLAALLRGEGFTVAEASNGNAALLLIDDVDPDVILLDLLMPPGPNGLETLSHLRERGRTAPVIMMSGKAQLTDAVRAVKLGAFQFLEKPLTPEAILVTVRAALELNRTRAENRALHAELSHRGTLIGDSAAMRQVQALIDRVGPTEARVLVTGESGTGKELVAAAIHRSSRRAGRALVTVNCAAIPRDLVESEMFGHERGAFTGATERRLGRFELA
ncbi:MAG: sigma-54-dependent Fis family transcriptional regulator, partial [Gemmatimonadales bacterium]|nr:sigma-54-dependent Fis family transcriptional regulator [Gemmatimonadales bacterium]